MKKILICGDSYMAFDDGRKNGHQHWARHLGTEFEIINRAIVGSSNTMINWQLMSAVEKINPDFIILGFTCAYRLEVSKTKTTCWPDIMAQSGCQEFYESYAKFIDGDIETHRNAIIIDQTIKFAQSHAPTVYIIGGFDEFLPEVKFFNLKESLESGAFEMTLRGHREWAFDDPEYCSFHVVDPQVHLDFAQKIRHHFLTL